MKAKMLLKKCYKDFKQHRKNNPNTADSEKAAKIF